jgi:segregation and condensation protein A
MTVDPPFAEEPTPPVPPPGDDLIVDLEGYEGPLDVLLSLARDQKVDLTRISILALADQYLAFIARARQLRLEIAADYLVMAAWLAFLKSRLLLPQPTAADAEPTASEMASALALQLRRLEAMQAAGARLMARPQLGREVFGRGSPEGLTVVSSSTYRLTLYELLSAYGSHRGRGQAQRLEIAPSALFTLQMAFDRIGAQLGRGGDWMTIYSFLPAGLASGLIERSALAALLAAGLELARTGKVQLRQDHTFGPIYLRRVESPVTLAAVDGVAPGEEGHS